MGTPAQQPDNQFTRMIAEVAERNRGGGMDRVEGPVTAGSQPSVRSAAYGIQPEQAPLTIEERMELDALAQQAGFMPFNEEEDGPYQSLADAQAAGAPVAAPREDLVSRQSAREFRAPSAVNALPYPKLPDFSQPGVLDLIRGVIYLDGLEFPIPAGDLAEFRAWCVTAVAADIQTRLNAALAQYAPKEATDGGVAGNEDVRQVQEDAGPSGVQSSVEPS